MRTQAHAHAQDQKANYTTHFINIMRDGSHGNLPENKVMGAGPRSNMKALPARTTHRPLAKCCRNVFAAMAFNS